MDDQGRNVVGMSRIIFEGDWIKKGGQFSFDDGGVVNTALEFRFKSEPPEK